MLLNETIKEKEIMKVLERWAGKMGTALHLDGLSYTQTGDWARTVLANCTVEPPRGRMWVVRQRDKGCDKVVFPQLHLIGAYVEVTLIWISGMDVPLCRYSPSLGGFCPS